MRSGAVNVRPNIETVRSALGLEVLHGDDGAGFIVGRDAMLRAVELAEQYNVGVVGAIRSNHFGATSIYARLAAERGMVGIAMTNVVRNVVAPGGSKPVIGNNPLALAVQSMDSLTARALCGQLTATPWSSATEILLSGTLPSLVTT